MKPTQGSTRVSPPRETLKYAERCLKAGQLLEAEAVCRQILKARPDVAEAEHLLGVVAHQTGRLGEAIEHLKCAATLAPQVALYHANLGEMCRLAGRVDDAIAAGRRAVALNPNYAGALNNLGIALFDQGKFDEALTYYDRAITRTPNFAQAYSNRGNALQRLKRFGDAEKDYRRAIDLQPTFADAWNNLGTCLRELRHFENAEAAYRKALEFIPNNPDTLDNLALTLKDLERFDEAAGLMRRALTIESRDEKLFVHYAMVLLDQRKVNEAAAQNERALALNANNHNAVNLAGRIAFLRGELGAAHAYYRRALTLKPDLADAYNNMGNVLKELGQLQEAREAFAQAIRLDPNLAGVYVNLADSKKFELDDPHLKLMESLAAKSEGLSKIDRLQLDFALGKAYGDLKDYRRSFAHLLAGNAAKRAIISYDETAVVSLFERIETVFTRELVTAKSGDGDPSRIPIFIIGMPRSGTTLIEQIIASHPMVHGGGELMTFNDVILGVHRPDGSTIPYPDFVPSLDASGIRQIGANYVAKVRALASGADRVTDKMPSNYYFAGLIRLALPNAKIIHSVRDPIDTCISCFSKLFTAEQSHTYDLAELGRYYKHYARLMGHWLRVLPAQTILDVRYEDVVADLEGQARRVIAYCGLPWDERCLSFHTTDRPVRTASATQVREPIYTSALGRWRRYAEDLAPLLAALDVSPRPGQAKRAK